jgi:hypothetical protein
MVHTRRAFVTRDVEQRSRHIRHERCSFQRTKVLLTFVCPGGRVCHLLVVRYQQQPGFVFGYVRRLDLFAPLRAVRKRERQLARFGLSKLVTLFARSALPGFNATMG